MTFEIQEKDHFVKKSSMHTAVFTSILGLTFALSGFMTPTLGAALNTLLKLVSLLTSSI